MSAAGPPQGANSIHRGVAARCAAGLVAPGARRCALRVLASRRLRARPSASSAAARAAAGGAPMSLKCGIVGLPNVGKSTLFNALTKAGIAAENYPFCTIEPNVGIVEVPDPRLAALAAIARPEKVLPATVEFVDIAGLVAGASKGEGLGNQFLANIRETDAIAHVVRCFDDDNVVHVAGKVDPISDIETDQHRARAGRPRNRREATREVREGSRAPAATRRRSGSSRALKKVEAVLDAGHARRAPPTSTRRRREVLRPFFLLTMKPTMYVANVAEGGFHDNPLLAAVEAHAAKEGAPVVAGLRGAGGGDRRSRR